MTSVLEIDYLGPDRPFSQKELNYMSNSTYKTLRIGQTRAHHKICDHFYDVKSNGRKEKEIIESKSSDVGNCSVCWKFNKTPRHLKTRARNLITCYYNNFLNKPKFLTFDSVDTQSTFYKWLYEEFN